MSNNETAYLHAEVPIEIKEKIAEVKERHGFTSQKDAVIHVIRHYDEGMASGGASTDSVDIDDEALARVVKEAVAEELASAFGDTNIPAVDDIGDLPLNHNLPLSPDGETNWDAAVPNYRPKRVRAIVGFINDLYSDYNIFRYDDFQRDCIRLPFSYPDDERTVDGIIADLVDHEVIYPHPTIHPRILTPIETNDWDTWNAAIRGLVCKEREIDDRMYNILQGRGDVAVTPDDYLDESEIPDNDTEEWYEWADEHPDLYDFFGDWETPLATQDREVFEEWFESFLTERQKSTLFAFESYLEAPEVANNTERKRLVRRFEIYQLALSAAEAHDVITASERTEMMNDYDKKFTKLQQEFAEQDEQAANEIADLQQTASPIEPGDDPLDEKTRFSTDS